MNLFILDNNPITAAQYYNNKHLIKIILEAGMMLKYAYPDSSRGPYFFHPMSAAVRSGRLNFEWALTHAQSLCREYTYRYGKVHKWQDMLFNLKPPILPESPIGWPRCFGEFKSIIIPTNDVVDDYRNYYLLSKRHLANWGKREKPFWYK